jgi:multicomponent Na+:H+ antiporter subunit E
MTRRWLALFVWAYLAWILLTWTRTAEQLGFGAGLAAVVATACLPLGPVARPWLLADPRRLFRLSRLVGYVVVQIVRANISLSRRIWTPSRPLRPGMIVIPTAMTTEGGLTAVGVLSSLIVDNQLIDVDRQRHLLQYHAVWTTSTDPESNRARITGHLEKLLAPLESQRP